MTAIDDALKSGAATLAPSNPLLAMAQGILDGIMSGRIASLGVITVGPRGEIACESAGMLPAVYVGCDLLKDDIKGLARGQGSGRILRPAG